MRPPSVRRLTEFLGEPGDTRERRVGHLFQGRYKAILVDGESYLLELVRYVHLNPVRSRLCEAPEAWRWSGHRAYLGRAAAPWLTTDWVLGLLAPGQAQARAAYRAFVADGMGEGRRPEFHTGNGGGGRLLGDDDFIARAMARAGEAMDAPPPLDAIIDAVAAAFGVAPADLADPSRSRLLSQARGLAGLIARDRGAAQLSHLAKRFGRDLSSYSRAVRRVETNLASNTPLRERAEAVNNAITQA